MEQQRKKARAAWSGSGDTATENIWFPLREKLGDRSRVPEGVQSIMEIIMNGPNLASLQLATRNAIFAAAPTHGLIRISAGNYGGRLGKAFIHLHEAMRL